MIPISRTSNLFSLDAVLYIFFFHIVVSILEMFPQGRKKSHELVRDEIQEIKQMESSQAVSIQFQKLEILACHLARSRPSLWSCNLVSIEETVSQVTLSVGFPPTVSEICIGKCLVRWTRIFYSSPETRNLPPYWSKFYFLKFRKGGKRNFV